MACHVNRALEVVDLIHAHADRRASGSLSILFQTRLSTSVQGFPITYAVGGRQYLAVPVGTGGGQWVTTIPSDLTPEKKIAKNANAMFVFALPK